MGCGRSVGCDEHSIRCGLVSTRVTACHAKCYALRSLARIVPCDRFTPAKRQRLTFVLCLMGLVPGSEPRLT